METNQRKLVLIALDGATFDLIDPWIDQGLLPTFKDIKNEGCSGELKSVLPPLTYPAWATVITGTNPGSHGIFDFMKRRPNSFDMLPVNSTSRSGKSLWKILNERGHKTGVVNIPNNYPFDELDGFVLPWMDASGFGHLTYPPELQKELRDNVGDYVVTVMEADKISSKENLAKNVLYMLKNRMATLEYLLRNKEWDFFAGMFSATDIAQHYFWDKLETTDLDENLILAVYKSIDGFLRNLIRNICPQVPVIIISDHGFGPLRRFINLNAWLQDNGYLTFRKSGLLSRCIKTIFDLSKQHLSHQLKGYLKRIFPELRNKAEGRLLKSYIQWDKTLAYSLGAYGSIYLNLAEREPEGIIESEDDYNRLVQEIIDQLHQLRDPLTKDCVVKNAYRGDQVFSGENTPSAPDILIEWNDGYHCDQRFISRSKEIFADTYFYECSDLEYTGSHRVEGIFLARGPQFKKNHVISEASLLDIPPTILYLMGVDIPDYFEGNVLADSIRSDILVTSPLSFARDNSHSSRSSLEVQYTEKEQEVIKSRLRGLGYIE
jgi:predicted AlkP superfamily phosphohydrolase/phosphomutase